MSYKVQLCKYVFCKSYSKYELKCANFKLFFYIYGIMFPFWDGVDTKFYTYIVYFINTNIHNITVYSKFQNFAKGL